MLEMFDLMFYPLLALIGIALLSGAYGCQMVWHKVACLGDALSHGALLGLAFGLLIGINETLSLFVLSLLWAVVLWYLTKSKQNSADTVMAFLMQASLALAILVFAFSGESSNTMMHAFIGDVLLTDASDAIAIFALDIILGIILLLFWKKWIIIAISSDLAKAQKININQAQLLFFTCIGFFVANAMQYLGALLAPAFFVMPALIARPLAKSPEQMAFFATMFALLAAVSGVVLSFVFDLPTGACIIGMCLIFLSCVLFCRSVKNILTSTPS